MKTSSSKSPWKTHCEYPSDGLPNHEIHRLLKMIELTPSCIQGQRFHYNQEPRSDYSKRALYCSSIPSERYFKVKTHLQPSAFFLGGNVQQSKYHSLPEHRFQF